MGFFDKLTQNISNSVNNNVNRAVSNGVNNAVNGAVNAAKTASNKKETFTFASIPTSVEELQALPENARTNPFMAAALTVIILCNYQNNIQSTIDMLNAIKGPRPLSNLEISQLSDRLKGKEYKPFSYLGGTSPANNYTPSTPYTVTVFENPYSYQNEGYAKLFVQSTGADSPREVMLRFKPSANEWFLWDQFLLSDIRIPVAQDDWA